MSRQEISEAIQGCAEKLGRTPSIFEVMKMAQVTRRQIRAHFGSYTHALRECKLEREITSGQKVPLEKLLADWAGVVRKTGKAPSMSEYEALSKYSCKPLTRCFGSWKQVAYGLTQFAEGRGLAEQWKAELAMAAEKPGDDDAQWLIQREASGVGEKSFAASLSNSFADLDPQTLQPTSTDPMTASGAGALSTTGTNSLPPLGPTSLPPLRPWRLPKSQPAKPTAGPTYGPPMWPGPLAYSPTNELGVVFLFGWMAPHLGFVVHRLQPEFPDCEAMRRVAEDMCQMVKIEFEHESRNFLKHMHDVKKCDLIICWRHNWPECPIEVLELRRLLRDRVIG